ncbi:MAG: signal recognition particle receptor subunit alpha, partial [Haloplanus sp.]
MFDGLKDKLSGFRKDVEESAEEVDETDADADVAEPEAGVERDADADVAEPEAGVERDADAATETGVESAESDEGTGGSGTSRFQRAKAFATGKMVIEEDDLEDPLWSLEMALLESDVEMGVAEAILEKVRENLLGETKSQLTSTGDVVEEALADALLDVISVGQFDFDRRIAEAEKPVTIIFTGVNGVGKTTTIAKMARYLETRGYSSVLANGDTYRAGANEQIREHADALGKRLIAHEQGGDPAAVIYDAVEYAEA